MKRILSVLLVAVVSASAQMRVPPKEDSRFLYDFAGLLNAEAKAEIEQIIRPLVKVKRPIVVLTVNQLSEYGASGETIERFARLVYNNWQIGSKTSGNVGALMVVAKGDRKMWIEIGEGVTPYRTSVATQISTEVVAPNFKEGDYAGGIREGVIAIRDRIFQPSTGEDLSNIPVEADPTTSSLPPAETGDLGLPGPPGTPGPPAGGGSSPPPRRDPSPPRQGPGPGPGADLNFNCGRWFCFAIGILVVISMFRRKRRYGYGYGPRSGPPPMGSQPPYGPPGYGYRRHRSGGLGGMLGGLLTGMLLGRAGRSHGGGGGVFGGGGGGGSVFGGGGGGGGGSVFGGGGGGGGGSSPFGGGSSGGGGGASW
jgi:hypothetical protein